VSIVATFRGAPPAPHPLAIDFTWADHDRVGRLLTAGQLQAFDRDGFLALERVIPTDVVERAIAEIDPFEDQTEQFLRGLDGGRLFIARAGEITFTTHLVLRSAWLRSFVQSALLRDLVHDLVGPDARLYWDQAVYKKPGTESPFPWHQDNGYAFVRPDSYLTCWIALTDATLDNGCPVVVPGVHRRGTLVHRPTELGLVCLDHVEGAVPVPVPAGSIVVFSSLTPHCTGPNRTSEVRRSYIVQYGSADARVARAPDGSEWVSCDDPGRQFSVLVGGEAPPDAPSGWPTACDAGSGGEVHANQ
jgi:ectoine hydroxylase-related dioxygenase (phytanoyl-CoA dioxygenase family)